MPTTLDGLGSLIQYLGRSRLIWITKDALLLITIRVSSFPNSRRNYRCVGYSTFTSLTSIRVKQRTKRKIQNIFDGTISGLKAWFIAQKRDVKLPVCSSKPRVTFNQSPGTSCIAAWRNFISIFWCWQLRKSSVSLLLISCACMQILLTS